MRRPKQSREVVRVSFWANKDVEWCKMESKVVKSRECDQGCENRQVFLVVQASTRNCRVVVEPEKTLGNRSTRMQCCSPPSKRATDEEEQEDERTNVRCSNRSRSVWE